MYGIVVCQYFCGICSEMALMLTFACKFSVFIAVTMNH